MDRLINLIEGMIRDIENSRPILFDYDEFVMFYNRLYSNYKTIIDNYDNNKLNIDKKNYLQDPHFTLHIIKNRTTTQSITAQVKWKYSIDNKIKKLKYHSVHIGTTKQFGTDLDSPTLLNTAIIKIKEYFIEKSPDVPVDNKMLNDNLELTDMFNKLRKNKDIISARLNPTFYISKVTNKSSHKSIVANIKWGFPYPGRSGNPRYITYYIGSENELKEDIKDEKFKDKIKSDIIDYLKVNSYKENILKNKL
jgi:hypothetical protein